MHAMDFDTPPALCSRRMWLRLAASSGLCMAAPGWAAAAEATALRLHPADSRVPGGVARLSLGPSAVRPRVSTAQGFAVLVMGDMIEWTALVGIPLSTPLGIHTVTVHNDDGTQSLDYAVQDKNTPSKV